MTSRLLTTFTSPSSALVPHWVDGASVGNLPNSANWQEISGGDTCRLPANAGYAFVVSDSPANVVQVVRLSDASAQGALTITGAPTSSPSDWEELASATIDGNAIWVIGDFGDNPSTRTSFNLIFFPEPTVTGSNITVSSGVVVANCIFPAGNMPTSKDCESIIFDAIDRKVYVITKRDATQKVYSLPYAASYAGQQTLTYEGAMTSLPATTTVPLTTTPCYAVGATISPNGKEILVKNYADVYYFPRNPATQTVIQALQQSLVIVPAYVGGGSNSPKKSHPNAEPQGECIFYSQNGRDLYTASEYLTSEGSSATAYPLFKYSRAAKVPTTVSFQDGVAPTAGYTGTTTTYIWGTNPTTDRSAETTFVVDTTPGTPSDDRRGLLKFDLSAIPANATVVGAELELWIAAEGQGWKCYKMLVPWTGSSTHTSLGGVDNDGVKAVATESWRNGVNLDTITGITVKDNVLVSDVQSMVSNPSTNYGWLFKGLDEATGDGVQFDSKASVTATRRPKLTVRYIA